VRILHITEASWAGTLEVVRTLASHQAARGHDVIVAYAEQPRVPADLAVAAGTVTFVPLSWPRRSLRAQLAVGRTLRHLARRHRPDIVHLHSSFAGAVGALALPRGVPLVYTPHGLAFARTGVSRAASVAVRAVEALIARRCAVLGAVSEAEADLARRGLGAPRVVVVRNGIRELDSELPPAPSATEAVVVAMGRIAAQRRPAATAQILSALAPAAEVAWIGGGEQGADAELRALGIPVTGWLPREEALERLSRASVYLHWSEWDGQSLAILEAMARNVVVVASDIPANREIVGPRQVCADERQAIELVQALLNDPELRRERLVEQRLRAPSFSAGRMSDEWLVVYGHRLRNATRGYDNTSTTQVAMSNIGDQWT
jgi:glycosyltransferase involved in cell wall biosynthesis